ncbi:hypothetical protein KC799_15075 [candidate division KSB1 bacterium]|nr:hypothetical protein [candidate division KSB1 bacterium]
MFLKKEFIKLVVVITVSSFLTHCAAYNRTTLQPENAATANKTRAIIRWKNDAYVFRNVSINETNFTGIVASSLRNFRAYSKDEFLHIYVGSELTEKLQPGFSFSLAVSDCDRIESYELDREKTVSNSILFAAPLIGLLVLIIYIESQGGYGLNLSGDPTGLSGDNDF